MDTRTYADRPACEPVRQQVRRCERARRRRERKEERVTLSVDLDAPVRRARLTHDPPVPRQRQRVGLLAKPVQEPCRSLDVREQERHRPSRETGACHQAMIRPTRR